ncbi:amidohydrolase [Paludifilum halophilum]|uniref:amidohydrolase n=1 Tax=Paludifilum halophilum TaxID=1642702 RepID=UPI001F0AB710|nr:amidohydrolase [Paludifilum halophilum]
MEKTIFFNGRFTTLEPSQPRAEAIYVENGWIRGVGSTQEIRLQFGGPDVRRVDLDGGFAYPGLVDNHLHLIGYGMKRSMLDFSQVDSKKELLRAIAEKASQTPPGEWIRGLNWDENRFDQPLPPTLEELDAVAPRHPVLLTRTCYHVQAVNTAAFQEAGISRDLPDPPGGSLGRDESGHLTGLIYENASKLFLDAMPEPSYEKRKEWARAGMKDAISKGLTGVHTEDLREAGSLRAVLNIYRDLIREEYYLRTHHLIDHHYGEELREVEISAGDGDEWVRIGAMKLFADGSIGGRTALLSEPYADDPGTRGMEIHSPEALQEWTRKARDLGMPIAVHAIGDQAAETAIRAMEAFPVQDLATGRFRDRLIHGQVLRRDLVDRLTRLQAVVDIQPRFVASDFPWVIRRLGPERLEYAYAWKTLLEAGIPCGAGSDAPIEPIDPLLGIHAAVTRTSPHHPSREAYLPQQKLTPEQALLLYTFGSACTASEEEERGTLKVGKRADLSVFDRDLLRIHPEELLRAEAVMTVTNGRIAYRR